MIRAAVIGLSEAGAEHARAYAAESRTTLAGVCDADAARAEAIAKELGVPAFTGAGALLAATKPDLCTVRTPVAERAAHIRAAIDAGAHVLAALPFSPDIAEAEDLAAHAAKAGKILAADFHLRFTPAIEKARAWLAAGELGTPLFINLNLWTRGAERPDPYDLFRNLGAHGADIMRLFFGEIARVQCFGTRSPGRTAWSSLQVNVQFAGEPEHAPAGTLTTSYDMDPRHPIARLEMAGTRARIVVENVYEEATLYIHADEEKRVVTNSIFGGVPQLKTTYGIRIGRLLDEIANGAAVTAGATDALAAARAMEAAIRACEAETIEEVGMIGDEAISGISSSAGGAAC
jgi:UDP-N-acetylglucosamine 3-dehydrogenase